jgi:tetratricopeptide (TPR) repeat protein
LTKPKTDANELFESAMMHGHQGNLPTAITQLHQCLVVNPREARAWNNRGLYLLQLGHPFDAVLNIDRAIALEPVAEYYNNRGVARADLQLWDDSVADYECALGLKPGFGEALVNMGNIHKAQGRKAPALAAYREAVRHNPEYVDGHLNLSFMELELGNFAAGWKEFEWRWKSSQLVPRGLPLPPWEGLSCKDPEEGLLLYTEQGHGDAIHFMRYAALAKERWRGKVYLEVRQPLARLAATMRGIDGVVCYGEALPPRTIACAPVMSCARILDTTVETIPGRVPYVFPSRERIESCQDMIKALPPGLRVGACWAGMSRKSQPACVAIDQRRSTHLNDWAPLAQVRAVSWVSLQKGGDAAAQVRSPPAGMTIADATEDLDDFYDTAAMIAGLDLVISVDTAVAHVAGALGVPTWLLSRYDGCWRWLGNQPTSPWYPSMRIFAQPEPGDWRSVMNTVQDELVKLVRASRYGAALLQAAE